MEPIRHLEISLELNARCSYVLEVDHVDDRLEVVVNDHSYAVPRLQSGTRARLLPLDPFLRGDRMNAMVLTLFNEQTRGVVAFNPWRLHVQLCQALPSHLLPIVQIDEGSAPRDDVPEGVVLIARLNLRLV